MSLASRLGRQRLESFPVVPWQDWFAKSTNSASGPVISVEEHSRIVGLIVDRLRSQLGKNLKALFPDCASGIASLHDVGKGSPGFLHHCSPDRAQVLSPEFGQQSFDGYGFETKHARIGEASVRTWARKRLGPDYEESRWWEVIGSHHGRREKFQLDADAGIYGGPEWQLERVKLIDHLFGGTSCSDLIAGTTSSQIKALAGLVTVADWIGSDERYFPAEGLREDDHRLDRRAGEALAECGWGETAFRRDLSFGDVFSGWKPNPVQRLFCETVDAPGLYVLEAPMGSGKTEAALYAAYRLLSTGISRGIYFALPTRLTSNRIHVRMEEFLRKVSGNATGTTPPARLIHADAWLEPGGEETGVGRSWFHPSKRALLYPFGVGTVDQALLSCLGVKHNFVRTFGLAGKVVVLDEVHSYDSYTGSLIDLFVRELLQLECTVFILSATLSTRRRRRFLPGSGEDRRDYPLISFAKRDSKGGADEVSGAMSVELPGQSGAVQMELECREAGPDELITDVVDRASAGQCVVWIENTVASAQEVYRKAASARKEHGFKLGLLHSRFPAFRRKEIEKDWMDALGKSGPRPEGCLLVSTQIVEQSVDIDADHMITALAPVDLVIQRAGRLWRHQRPARPAESPKLLIRCPPGFGASTDPKEFKAVLGPDGLIYHPSVLLRAYLTLKSRKSIRLPGDIRGLTEETFGNFNSAPLWLSELDQEYEKGCLDMEMKARGMAAIEGFPDDEERAPTRWNERPTAKLLLLKSFYSDKRTVQIEMLNGDRAEFLSGQKSVSLARILHRNLVPVPWKRWMEGERRPEGDWLSRLVFGRVIPIVVKGVDCHNLGDGELPFCYSNDIGVYSRDVATRMSEFDEFMW